MVINYTKFASQMLVIICTTVLMALNKLDITAYLAINGPLVGFIAGNGNSAFKGAVALPTIAPSAERVSNKEQETNG